MVKRYNVNSEEDKNNVTINVNIINESKSCIVTEEKKNKKGEKELYIIIKDNQHLTK